jgi:hypothetical protein
MCMLIRQSASLFHSIVLNCQLRLWHTICVILQITQIIGVTKTESRKQKVKWTNQIQLRFESRMPYEGYDVHVS